MSVYLKYETKEAIDIYPQIVFQSAQYGQTSRAKRLRV